MVIEQEIASWLERYSLNLEIIDTVGRLALLFSAGLNEFRNTAINFNGSVYKFCNSLILYLMEYGTLSNNKSPIIELLKACKGKVGKEGQDECENFIRRLQRQQQETHQEDPPGKPHQDLSTNARGLLENIRINPHSSLKGISLVTERTGGWYVPYIFCRLSNEEIDEKQRVIFHSDRTWSEFQNTVHELKVENYLTSYFQATGGDRTIERLLLTETITKSIQAQMRTLLFEISTEHIGPDTPPFMETQGLTIFIDKVHDMTIGHYIPYFYEPFLYNLIKHRDLEFPPNPPEGGDYPIIEIRLAAKQLVQEGKLRPVEKSGVKFLMERYEYIQ